MSRRQHLSKGSLDGGNQRRDFAGLIFMCNDRTERECFRHKIFGLPLAKIDLVEQVHPGTILFLYNFDRRELLGIYEAVSHGGLNLEPRAFQDFRGSYPAQVRFGIYRECLPLPEAIFKNAIIDNYSSRSRFGIELTTEQVFKLKKLFRPIEPPRKRIESGSVIKPVHWDERDERVLLDYPRVHDGYPLDAEYHERLHHPLVIREALERDVAPFVTREALVNRGVGPLQPRKRPLADSELLLAGQLERLPRVDAPGALVPQAVGLGGSASLLEQGCLNEVDQLALKYLKRTDPSVTASTLRALDLDNQRLLAPPSGNSLSLGRAPLLSQDPLHHGLPPGAVRLLRDEDGRLLIPHSRGSHVSSLAPLGRQFTAGSSREPRGLRAP